MGKSVTFAAILAVAAALGAVPLAAQETTPAETSAPTIPQDGADAIVAVVNGTPITLGHMIVLRANLPAQYQALPDETLFNGILNQLIQQAALAQSVEGKTTLRDRLAMENDQRGYLSGVALQGVASEAVTDAALQKAYDAKFETVADTKEYHAAHILVKTEEEAKDIKAQLDAGGDFADLAMQHSSDGAAAGGGDLGWFSQGMMVKPFEDAVVAMEVGKISDPVQTQFGWHLIQLQETRIKAAPTLDDMREDLASEIEQAAVEAHIKTITDSAKIERPGAGFDPALMRDLSLLDK
ncbi:peptidylprolyl isomerase [Pseudorhodobacter sp.]|uniref:peptidylprolyl isomerase n=1 Tax=Pseudorhodobacter sp. TaxID=1934400 RepID=UPI0039E5BC07